MQRTFSMILSLLSALTVGACSAVFKSPPAADQDAKLFAPPQQPARTAVYLFRDASYSSYWPVKVHVLDSVDTELPARTFIRVDVQSGPTDLGCVSNGLADHWRNTLAAGDVRYFQVKLNAGNYGPYCLVVEVAPDYGQAAIRAARRIEAVNP